MSERRPPGAVGVLVVTAALLVAAVILTLRWAGEDREFLASVPQPPPLATTPVVPVPPDGDVCLEGATLVPQGKLARIRIGTRRKPGVPVTATLSAPGGYRQTARLPGTWKDNELLTFRFDPPDRPVHGTFCLRNEGRRTVDVYGAGELSRTIAVTTVNGRRQPANMQLTFVEEKPGTIRDHAEAIVDELSLFRPGVVGPVLLWALFGLVLAGVPLGIGFALWRALREPDPDAPDPSGAPEGGAQADLDLPGRGGPGAPGDEVAAGGRAS